jgi:hypothetical protein
VSPPGALNAKMINAKRQMPNAAIGLHYASWSAAVICRFTWVNNVIQRESRVTTGLETDGHTAVVSSLVISPHQRNVNLDASPSAWRRGQLPFAPEVAHAFFHVAQPIS